MKFSTGFVLGALVGTTYAVLTAKRTGPDRQRAIAGYVEDVTAATGSVQAAVKRFGNAVSDLQKQVKETLAPNLEAISADVEDFSFQTQAHTQALNEHLEKVNDALAAMPAPEVDSE